MAPTPAAIHPFLLVAGATFLLLGLLLSLRGRRTLRAGPSRHCRRCDYTLDGLAADTRKCPECGLDIAAPGNAVHSRRIRRPRLIWAGAALTLIGFAATALSLYDRVLGIDWYAKLPTVWVLNDLNSADPARRARGWIELSARLGRSELSDSQTAEFDAAVTRAVIANAAPDRPAMLARLADRFAHLSPAHQEAILTILFNDIATSAGAVGTDAARHVEALRQSRLLSDAQDGRLVEFALREQGATSRPAQEGWVLGFLDDRAASGAMSPPHRERFFLQALPARLVVRPSMIAGESIPYRLESYGRGPRDGWWSSDEVVSARVDDRAPTENGSSGRGMGFINGASSSSVPVETPGDHVLHLTYKVAAYRPPTDQRHQKSDPPVWQHTYELSAPFKALPKLPPDYVKLRRDPQLADRVRRSIIVREARASATHPKEFAVDLMIDGPPIGLAFDAVVKRADGKEYSAGTLTARPADAFHTMLGHGVNFYEGNGEERITLILRPNPRVARDTVDVHEIFDGAIEIPDIKATLDSPTDKAKPQPPP